MINHDPRDSTRTQNAGSLGNAPRRIGRVMKDPPRIHEIETSILEWQIFRVSLLKI